MRLERGVRACVRLEPLVARRAEHVPDDAEHGDEQLVARRDADHLVEARVLLGVRLARGDLALLLDEELTQLTELHRRDARRRERRDGGLDDAAELDDVGQAVPARDERVQRPREIVRRDLAHERAAAGPRLDDAEELERPKRFPHRGAGDLELFRERPLRGELVAGVELALLEEGLDLLDDALVEPAAADRLDGGRRTPPKTSGQVVRPEARPPEFGRQYGLSAARAVTSGARR